WPAVRVVPGGRKPAMARSSVVFPAPDGPVRATRWPGRRVREASRIRSRPPGAATVRPVTRTVSVSGVTTAPSFSQAPLRCLVKGLGGSRGDGLVRSPLDGLYDTTAPGSREASDRQQGDAPQSAG